MIFARILFGTVYMFVATFAGCTLMYGVRTNCIIVFFQHWRNLPSRATNDPVPICHCLKTFDLKEVC